MIAQHVMLDCPNCGREVRVSLRWRDDRPEVIAVECPAQCQLSLQDEFDLEVEALAIAEERTW